MYRVDVGPKEVVLTPVGTKGGIPIVTIAVYVLLGFLLLKFASSMFKAVVGAFLITVICFSSISIFEEKVIPCDSLINFVWSSKDVVPAWHPNFKTFLFISTKTGRALVSLLK